MTPPLSPLAKSASKRHLYAHLGLDPADKDHRRLYELMKSEATEAHRRIVAFYSTGDLRTDRDVLANGPSLATSRIDKQIMEMEISYIYRNAQPATRLIYDLGRSREPSAKPNWIIGWMIWHVFRYRDGRQKSSTPAPYIGDAREGSTGPGELDGQKDTL